MTVLKQTIKADFPTIEVNNSFSEDTQWQLSISTKTSSDKISSFRIIDGETITTIDAEKTLITSNQLGIFNYDFDIAFDIPAEYKLDKGMSEIVNAEFKFVLSQIEGP